METNPEYASAVNRLRIRKCNFDDVDLFNSRTIMNSVGKNGVKMGTPEIWKQLPSCLQMF